MGAVISALEDKPTEMIPTDVQREIKAEKSHTYRDVRTL